MPELPEVQHVVNSLLPVIVGRRLTAISTGPHDVTEPRGFDLRLRLEGRRIERVYRRAKRIVFELDGDDRFYIHLGMSGTIIVCPRQSPVRPHTHLRADLDNQTELRFSDPRRFGGIFWMGRSFETENDLGPEPFDLCASDLLPRLATARVIKTALLDQSVIAGLGNIYVDESLFAARIHPRQPARTLTLTQATSLLSSVKRILNRAIAAGGSSLRDYVDAAGNKGSFQNAHRVYDRAGKACSRCRTPIERIVLHQRSTHFCPACQCL